MLALLTLLVGFPRRSDIPEYDVADLPALREIDIDALLPQIPDADPRRPPALSQPSPSYVEKYKATKPASPNGAAKSAVGASVD